MSVARDDSERLRDAVARAFAVRQPLAIAGSGSKSFLTAERDSASLLSVAEHVGIVDYRPEELVVTVRAGTGLRDVAQALVHHGQMLPFEPPMFGGRGTVGGALATGLSGPGRPWWGSVRDSVLGVELINGMGEQLRFGGQVMKNVAGYDLWRLQVGAFGSLGVLLSVSLKLLPKPGLERTCTLEVPPAEALDLVRSWARLPLPITATCHCDGLLRVRVSGAEAAVAEACREIGGDASDDVSFWQRLRDHELPAFRSQIPLWRLSLPPAASSPLDGAIIEWGGALRWWHTDREAVEVRALAQTQGGSAARFGADYANLTAPGMSGALVRYHRRIKEAFDPGNILNPGFVNVYAD